MDVKPWWAVSVEILESSTIKGNLAFKASGRLILRLMWRRHMWHTAEAEEVQYGKSTLTKLLLRIYSHAVWRGLEAFSSVPPPSPHPFCLLSSLTLSFFQSSLCCEENDEVLSCGRNLRGGRGGLSQEEQALELKNDVLAWLIPVLLPADDGVSPTMMRV